MKKSSLKKGDKYGRLLLNRPFWRIIGTKRRKKELFWRCLCDCGTVKTVRSCAISSGYVKSCGCLRSENARHKAPVATGAIRKHGESVAGGAPLYRLWSGIKSRCRSDRYEIRIYYKDRGIRVCRAWRDDYLAFKAWAIVAGYRKNLQIDRINGAKGYSPNNCRFVTPKAQANNRRPARPHGTVNVRKKRGYRE